MQPRTRIMLKPVGRGLEVVGFIPAGTDYAVAAPENMLLAAWRWIVGTK